MGERIEFARIERDGFLQRQQRARVIARRRLKLRAHMPAFGKIGGEAGDGIEHLSRRAGVAGLQRALAARHQQVDRGAAGLLEQGFDLGLDGVCVVFGLCFRQIGEQLVELLGGGQRRGLLFGRMGCERNQECGGKRGKTHVGESSARSSRAPARA